MRLRDLALIISALLALPLLHAQAQNATAPHPLQSRTYCAAQAEEVTIALFVLIAVLLALVGLLALNR